ncbi:nucleotidyl transferase AbiEii/AbiGii toxin family protein [Candidatus Peregrinibacteria bacterium]|nr:nucleotidyl transferase AbiEii/AbiGii toxin family protein [Candidatus Peregrinibacteria bacterium]
MNPYGRIFTALNKAKIQYLVVGGVAMNLHGYPRFTGDLDILLALNEKNVEKMGALMKKMNYEKKLPVALEELSNEGKVEEWIRNKNLTAFTFENVKEPQFNIDVIVGESLKFEKYKKHQMILKTWNIRIPVVSIDDLIKMKRKSDRKKDAEDVAALIELKGL